MSLSNIRSSVLRTGLPKCQLNMDLTNEHDTLDREKLVRSQPYTKIYRGLKIAGSGRDGLPQGREFVIQSCRTASCENIQVTLYGQATLRDAVTRMKSVAMNLKENAEGVHGKVWREDREGRML